MKRVSSFLAPIGAVIVTGGTSGIGRSFISVIGQAKPDTRVCNLSRSYPEKFPEGFTLQHVACDLADTEQRASAVSEVETFIGAAGGRAPVLLINNAGIGAYGLFPSVSAGLDNRVVALNVAAVVDLTASLLPLLKTHGGGIINVASTAAFQATPFAATYGASKAFILNWSLALREELRPHGVRVTVVCPGPTRTAFFKTAGLDGTQADGALGLDADEVARCALMGLARNRAIVVPGWRNKLIAAASAVAPRTWAAYVSGRVLARVRPSGGTEPE